MEYEIRYYSDAVIEGILALPDTLAARYLVVPEKSNFNSPALALAPAVL